LLRSGKFRGKKNLGSLKNIAGNVRIFIISGHAKNNVPQNQIACKKWTWILQVQYVGLRDINLHSQPNILSISASSADPPTEPCFKTGSIE
jgi:hypothetical protein